MSVVPRADALHAMTTNRPSAAIDGVAFARPAIARVKVASAAVATRHAPAIIARATAQTLRVVRVMDMPQKVSRTPSCSVLGSPTAVICPNAADGASGYSPAPKFVFRATGL